jgi:hypothetical protein
VFVAVASAATTPRRIYAGAPMKPSASSRITRKPELSWSGERMTTTVPGRSKLHNHRLHYRVSAVCCCCQLAHDFVFKSANDPAVCKGCRRHVGSSDETRHLRSADHAALYLSEIRVLREDLADARVRWHDEGQREFETLHAQLDAKDIEIAEQANLISDLRAAVRTGEIGSSLTQWLADEEVVEALAERDRSRRSMNLVFQALSRLGILHGRHETRPHYCVCGKHVDQCSEYQAIVSELDVLAKWEREQFERHRDDLEHGLSDEKIRLMLSPESLRREA